MRQTIVESRLRTGEWKSDVGEAYASMLDMSDLAHHPKACRGEPGRRPREMDDRS